MKSIASRLRQGRGHAGRIGLLKRFVVEDQVAVRFRVCRGPVGGERLGGYDTVGENLADLLAPAFDDTVRAADDGQLASNHSGSQDSRERLAGPGARPVADALLIADADGEMPLHEVRQRSAWPLTRKA